MEKPSTWYTRGAWMKKFRPDGRGHFVCALCNGDAGNDGYNKWFIIFFDGVDSLCGTCAPKRMAIAAERLRQYRELHDPVGLCFHNGEDAALPVVSIRLATAPSPWGPREISEFSSWAREFTFLQAWRLAALIWGPLIEALRSKGKDEDRAYYYNDLGQFLLSCGDDRCFLCFTNALHLTRKEGRRMRTLGRLGIASVLVRRDHERARKFFKAATIVGDRASYNPLHIEQAKMQIRELDLDKEGRSVEFSKQRQDLAQARIQFATLLERLEVPVL